jgi:hypothetical protein
VENLMQNLILNQNIDNKGKMQCHKICQKVLGPLGVLPTLMVQVEQNQKV